MSRDEARRWLERLLESKAEFESQWNRVEEVTRWSCDSPFGESAWKMFALLVESVSELIGDDVSAVSWFIWENDCGKKSLKHSRPDGTMSEVKTIDDLLDLVGY